MAQSLIAMPVEPTGGEGTVVRWSKWDGYLYASINDGDGVWYTSQDPRRTGGNKILPGTWEELLDKIGQQNWPTLELLA